MFNLKRVRYLIELLFLFRPGNFSCACNIGYELYSSNGTAGFAIEKSETGERDGDTYQRNKSCVPVMCPPLGPPENGKLLSTKDAYHFGDIVQFQCEFGFVMSGFSSLLCTSSGTWNGTAPLCQCESKTRSYFYVKACHYLNR